MGSGKVTCRLCSDTGLGLALAFHLLPCALVSSSVTYLLPQGFSNVSRVCTRERKMFPVWTHYSNVMSIPACIPFLMPAARLVQLSIQDGTCIKREQNLKRVITSSSSSQRAARLPVSGGGWSQQWQPTGETHVAPRGAGVTCRHRESGEDPAGAPATVPSLGPPHQSHLLVTGVPCHTPLL